MTDWELIFTMLGEKATTDITIAKDAKGLEECKETAQKGGKIAHDARVALEKETGTAVISDSNFLGLQDTKKIEHKKKLK